MHFFIKIKIKGKFPWPLLTRVNSDLLLSSMINFGTATEPKGGALDHGITVKEVFLQEVLPKPRSEGWVEIRQGENEEEIQLR